MPEKWATPEWNESDEQKKVASFWGELTADGDRKNKVCRPSWMAPHFFLNRALLRANPTLVIRSPCRWLTYTCQNIRKKNFMSITFNSIIHFQMRHEMQTKQHFITNLQYVSKFESLDHLDPTRPHPGVGSMIMQLYSPDILNSLAPDTADSLLLQLYWQTHVMSVKWTLFVLCISLLYYVYDNCSDDTAVYSY